MHSYSASPACCKYHVLSLRNDKQMLTDCCIRIVASPDIQGSMWPSSPHAGFLPPLWGVWLWLQTQQQVCRGPWSPPGPPLTSMLHLRPGPKPAWVWISEVQFLFVSCKLKQMATCSELASAWCSCLLKEGFSSSQSPTALRLTAYLWLIEGYRELSIIENREL